MKTWRMLVAGMMVVALAASIRAEKKDALHHHRLCTFSENRAPNAPLLHPSLLSRS
jgi:hypothetical protein